MKENVAFTICSKNYLAQAFTLKESFLKYNSDKDFYIFLADKIDETVNRFDEVVQLSTDFIPRWEEMAFKYAVVEFNTSIKPFCINKLFNDGYKKVIYLDPDIYVTDSLNPIIQLLDSKDFVLNPHYCHITGNYNGAVPENSILGVGIFNLGFCAVRNSKIGNEIISWWMNKLADWCYADSRIGVFVDQKWMSMLPGFYQNNLCILQDPGVNVAIWNLHERLLHIENNKYLVEDIFTGDIKPLLFFHFSGFDPFSTEYINRRHPQFNITTFPSFKPIIEEYRNLEYKNGYEYYSKLKYSFGEFENGTMILPINRRIFAKIAKDYPNPFTNKDLYSFFSNLNLLSKRKNTYSETYKGNDKNLKAKLLIIFFKFMLKVLKADNYSALLRAMQTLSSYGCQDFLYEKISWSELLNR